MFANLKNKLIEEVKASPSKLQQLANAAQAAVSSSSSTPSGSESTTTTTTNENFFSITEEDTPQNSPYRPLKLPPGTVRGRSTTPQALFNNGTGAIPRARKLSNSSMASDVSFRLPSYDAPAVYHLQSDLDETASEIDDSAFTAKLDAITKEQLYDAYKKSLDRYHKYRCRYTDLAKKYKDLEHDSTKARSVLVETQDKAIRRISELREQCVLEQEAKAHLEEALRMEMDDMQCKMQAYQTKLQLLGENPEHTLATLESKAHTVPSADESLIDLGHGSEQDAKTGHTASNLINLESETAKIEVTTTQAAQLEQELSARMQELTQATITIEQLRKQEEKNTLLLAQTKQAILSELENKESEVKQLKNSLQQVQAELQTLSIKEAQLGGQVHELKDKLKQERNSQKEVNAKLIAAEHLLSELREQNVTNEKASLSIEQQFGVLTKESEQKLSELRQQNSQLSEMIQRYQQSEVSLAEIDNELNRTKNENDNLKGSLAEKESKLQELSEELLTQQDLLKRSKQEQLAAAGCLLAEQEQAKQQLDELAKQLETERAQRELHAERLRESANTESEATAALKAELLKLRSESSEQLRMAKEQLASTGKELKATTNKLGKQKKQHDTQQHRITEQNEEIEKLKTELNRHELHLLELQNEASEREEQAEREKNELKAQVTNILNEISHMEEQMRVVQSSHVELEVEKRKLELMIEDMQGQAKDVNADTQRWREQLAEGQEKVSIVEAKLLQVESENTQLGERNCLLEENSQRMEKLLAERERQCANTVSELHLKWVAAEDALSKLNEKMSQVLDENSRMQNVQELMDHDCRTLQDKCDALEKEKLVAQDAEQCLQTELAELKERKCTQDLKLIEVTAELQQTGEQLTETQKRSVQIEKQLQQEKSILKQLQGETISLRTQLEELKAIQAEDRKRRDSLLEKQSQLEALQQEVAEKTSLLQESKEEITVLRSRINHLEEVTIAMECVKEELEMLRKQRESLTDELETSEKRVVCLRESCDESAQESLAARAELDNLRSELEQHKCLLLQHLEEKTELQGKLETYIGAAEELNSAREEVNQVKDKVKGLHDQLAERNAQVALQTQQLQAELDIANADVEKLHESNDAFQLVIDQLKEKHELQLHALEKTLKQLQEEHGDLQAQVQKHAHDEDKLSHYEQLQLENEYLNKHARQLEGEFEALQRDTHSNSQDGDELREKLNSMQCELYVLKENTEKHDALLLHKQAELTAAQQKLETLTISLDNERAELTRQSEHSKYVTEQNDGIQKELLQAQHKLREAEQKQLQASTELDQIKKIMAHEASNSEQQMKSLHIEIDRKREAIETLQKEVNKITAELHKRDELLTELQATRVGETSGNKNNTPHADEALHLLNGTLQRELEELRQRSVTETNSLQQEIEDLKHNNKHMMERMLEMESIRAGLQAQKLLAPVGAAQSQRNTMQSEQETHEAKLKAIIAEVQDVSNRNLFLEQKCENYLVLEQSNERLKLQNAKLSRQLDETLVSMQHNEGITANTEFEYLRNIMFQYLTGTASGNNETLVKVISAVLKFSPQQTQVALEKEHQRRSLLNKIL